MLYAFCIVGGILCGSILTIMLFETEIKYGLKHHEEAWAEHESRE